MRGRWTPAEDAVLRRLWPKRTARDIAAELGRTAEAVLYRGHRIGLSLEERCPQPMRKRPERAPRGLRRLKHDAATAMRALNRRPPTDDPGYTAVLRARERAALYRRYLPGGRA